MCKPELNLSEASAILTGTEHDISYYRWLKRIFVYARLIMITDQANMILCEVAAVSCFDYVDRHKKVDLVISV